MRILVTVSIGKEEVGRQVVRPGDVQGAVSTMVYQAMALQRDDATNEIVDFRPMKVDVVEYQSPK